MVNELILHFKVLTPLYLGGASQQAELRAPGFKGPLRMWYRAVDPKFFGCRDNHGFKEITREDHFFGGCRENAGQSPFLMRIVSEPFREFVWDKAEIARYNKGKGPDTVNGLAYLGYPFGLNEKKSTNTEERTAVAPGHTFSIRCVIPPNNNNQDLRRVLAASWWCLGNLGGVGSRSRRGFGSLALMKWETTPEPWPELDALPFLSDASSLGQWQDKLQTIFKTLNTWFGSFNHQPSHEDEKKVHHPHLDNKCRIKLLDKSFSFEEWANGMAHMGELMQRYRKDYQADKQMIKKHLLALEKKGGDYLEHAPDKSTFGLPLTFRFKGFRQSLEFDPFDSENHKTKERHGSLLLMRLAVINKRLYPLFVRLSGDVPGETPAAAIRNDKRPLRRPAQNAMDLFLNTL